MKKSGYLAAALAAAAVTLAACGDSTGSSGAASGSLSFTYTGARTGSYSATGSFKRTSDSTFAKQPFAVAARGSDGQLVFLEILSYQPVTSSTGTLALFSIPSVASPTTIPLDSACDTSDCPFGGIVFNTDPNASEDESEVYFFDTGSIQVTSVTNSRLQGTFSGTATEFLGEQTITVTNGTFDVPLVSQSFLGSRALPPAVIRASRR